MQLDRGEKGFSFLREGPLDMRMDPTLALTAKEIVNKWPQQKLGELFREFGEEPHWRRAAEAICAARKKGAIETTLQLSDILSAALSYSRKKLHPATLIFQALRICVNDELGAIKTALLKAIDLLDVGGKMGVLSFHSLEDRIVKNIFRDAAKAPKRSEIKPTLRLLTKKPVEPTFEEARQNPRSRSAKLRFAEKLGFAE